MTNERQALREGYVVSAGRSSPARGHVGTHKGDGTSAVTSACDAVQLGTSRGRHLRDEYAIRAKPIASETRLEGNVWSRGPADPRVGHRLGEALVKRTAAASVSGGPGPGPADHAPVCEAAAPPGRGASSLPPGLLDGPPSKAAPTDSVPPVT